MKLLEQKGLLNIIITQNIDGLELEAGINQDKVVGAHGNLKEAHCPKCNKDVDIKVMDKHIQEGKVFFCSHCKDVPCKYKVVFYGEQLPKQFFNSIDKLKDSDLVFIMGTSLRVKPFSELPYYVDKTCVRALINKEEVGIFKFDEINSRDVFIESFTDDAVNKIVEYCGWKVTLFSLFNYY